MENIKNTEWRDYTAGDENSLPKGQAKVLRTAGRMYMNDYLRWRVASNWLLLSRMTRSGSTKVETYGERGGFISARIHD